MDNYRKRRTRAGREHEVVEVRGDEERRGRRDEDGVFIKLKTGTMRRCWEGARVLVIKASNLAN